MNDGDGEVAFVHGSLSVSRRLVLPDGRDLVGSLVRDGREAIQGALPRVLEPQERSRFHLHPEPQPSAAREQTESGPMGRPTSAVQKPASDVRHERSG